MPDIKKLLTLIDENEVIQVTRDMVAIPSITGQEGNGMLTFLKRWFEDLNIPVREYPCDGDRAHFFADFGATSGQGRVFFKADKV